MPLVVNYLLDCRPRTFVCAAIESAPVVGCAGGDHVSRHPQLTLRATIHDSRSEVVLGIGAYSRPAEAEAFSGRLSMGFAGTLPLSVSVGQLTLPSLLTSTELTLPLSVGASFKIDHSIAAVGTSSSATISVGGQSVSIANAASALRVQGFGVFRPSGNELRLRTQLLIQLGTLEYVEAAAPVVVSGKSILFSWSTQLVTYSDGGAGQ